MKFRQGFGGLVRSSCGNLRVHGRLHLLLSHRGVRRSAFRSLLTVDAPIWQAVSFPVVEVERSLSKAMRILALVLFFVDKLKRKRAGQNQVVPGYPAIPSQFFVEAKDQLLRVGQMIEFGDDYRRLASGHQVLQSSRLRKIHPSFDVERRLIVGNARNQADPSLKLPVLAVTSSVERDCRRVTPRIFKGAVMDAHRRIFHMGAAATIAELQRHYVVIKGRADVKRILRTACYGCKRTFGRPFKTKEGRLPDFRVTPARPFQHTGMDFLGPLQTPRKRYVLLFTCAVVRAVHLEVTEGMSAEEVQRAVRRFVARRGQPKVFYCDNAPQFLHLNQFLEGTELKLIPPYAPWFGGFYERLVACVKRALRATFLLSKLKDDELRTVVAEIEEAINRRPLYPTQEEGQEVLTPYHFLYGCPPIGQIQDSEGLGILSGPSCLRMWNRIQSFGERLWNRFRDEYLLTLRNWRLKDGEEEYLPVVGEIVLVKGDGPRLQWSRGKIERLVDGHVAEVKLRGRVVRRAIKHLYPLEVDELEMPKLTDETLVQASGAESMPELQCEAE